MITFTIVVIYLSATLAVGFIMKRRTGKDSTIRDFFIANGSMPVFAVTTMLFGDLIAASTTTGTAGTGYSTGLTALWGIWGSSLGCILFSVFFCKFFFEVRTTGAMTGPEAFGIRFDSKIRYLVLIFTLITLFIIFSTQVTAASMYLSSMLNIDEIASTFIVFVLFLAMALLGITGMAEMNKLHSFVILFGLTFAALTSLHYVGGVNPLLEKLPSSYFDLFANGAPTALAQFIGGALGFSVSVTSINIGYCAKNIRIAKQSHIAVAIISALFAFAPTIVGLCAAITFTDIRPDLALYSMTNEISPYLSGITVMAVFAAIFSTGPYFLLEISKLIVKELYIPMKALRGETVSDRTGLRMSRIIITTSLLFAVAVSGTNVSLLESLMSASQIKAITVILLLFGLYWKRTSNSAGFAGLLCGGTASTIWYYAGNPFGIQPLWPGVALAIAIIVVGSLIASKNSVSKDYVAYRIRLKEKQCTFTEAKRGNSQ